MVSRAEADKINRAKIAVALKSNPLVIKAQRDGRLTASAAANMGLSVNAANQIDIVQSAFGKSGLGAATIAAQQALAEKYGIVTFDVEGNISAIPQTRSIDTSINVGTGRFTESAFTKSLEVLAPKTDLIANFSNGINDIILKPIVNAWNSIFGSRDILDLPEQQQIRVKEIETRIGELRKQLTNLPPCSDNVLMTWNGRQWINTASGQNCTARDNAIAANAIFEVELKALTEEKESIFKKYVIEANFEKQVLEQAEIINELVKINPVSATIKAEIQSEIQTASKLIEEILTKGIKIETANLSELQKAMVAGAHRLNDQVSAQSETANNLADSILKGISDFGASLGDLGGVVEAIIEGITKSFDKVFNPSVEDIIEKQKKMHEYQMTEYAKFIEESQRFLAQGVRN